MPNPVTQNNLFYSGNVLILRQGVTSGWVNLIHFDPALTSVKQAAVLAHNVAGQPVSAARFVEAKALEVSLEFQGNSASPSRSSS